MGDKEYPCGGTVAKSLGSAGKGSPAVPKIEALKGLIRREGLEWHMDGSGREGAEEGSRVGGQLSLDGNIIRVRNTDWRGMKPLFG